MRSHTPYAITFVLCALMLLAFMAYAGAHPATDVSGYPLGWNYPPACCNSAATDPDGDCAPIDARYVTEGPDGYHVNLPVGAHPKLISRGYSDIIPYGTERASPEGNFHICLTTNGTHRFCFFAGARGF